MTSSMEIGSIIGGRYRITGHVVSSAEGDDVLAGLDQVLNRGVSILVAAKKNASQATQSGRELATGERRSSIQVLDMVITDGRPALITNTAQAHDLLDLLVNQEKPYVEPFFTESLGSEIFGQKREALPEEDLEWDESYYDLREEKPLIDLSSMSERARAKAAERAAARDAAAAQKAEALRQKEAAERAEEEQRQAVSASRPAPSAEPEAAPAEADRPRTAWGFPQGSSTGSSKGSSAVAPAAAAAAASSSVRPLPPEEDASPATQAVPHVEAPLPPAKDETPQRSAVRPLGPEGDAARPAAAQPVKPAPVQEKPARKAPVADAAAPVGETHRAAAPSGSIEAAEASDESKGRLFSRALVGLLLAALLIGAVVLAVSQLGSLFKDGGFAGASKPSATQSSTPSSTPSAASKAPAAAAQIASIQRLVPDNPTLDAGSDANLGRIIDGNPQSAWGSLVYTNPNFGNLTKSFALVIELKEPAQLSELQLTQQYGSGGAFTVLVNDSASLEGAQQVGTGSFSSANVNVALTGTTAKKYVILNVTELPRLNGVQAVYPWGMVISEISVK